MPVSPSLSHHRITIDHLASQGDGRFYLDGQAYDIPKSLPGEAYDVLLSVTTLHKATRLTSSLSRKDPPCPYFHTCGGCDLQHLSPEDIGVFKRQKIDQALKKKGIVDVPLRNMVSTPPGLKRRGVFRFRRDKRNVFHVGFFEKKSRTFVPIKKCLLFTPEIQTCIQDFSQKMGPLCPFQKGKIHVLHSQTGLDIWVQGEGPCSQDAAFEQALSCFLKAHPVARFKWGTSPPLTFSTPRVDMAGISVKADVTGFFQPSDLASQLLVEQVYAYVKKTQVTQQASLLNKEVYDLFSGRGLFSWALAKYGFFVKAFEGDVNACKAFEETLKGHDDLLKRIRVHRRDLFKETSFLKEVDQNTGVILDPPRDGAHGVCQNLSQSCVTWVIYVSCRPETFARDARLLINGGLNLIEIAPFDLFPYAHHCELVAFFTR